MSFSCGLGVFPIIMVLGSKLPEISRIRVLGLEFSRVSRV